MPPISFIVLITHSLYQVSDTNQLHTHLRPIFKNIHGTFLYLEGMWMLRSYAYILITLLNIHKTPYQ